MRLLLLVVAWHYQLAYLLAERSPQERDDLRAGTVLERCKEELGKATCIVTENVLIKNTEYDLSF